MLIEAIRTATTDTNFIDRLIIIIEINRIPHYPPILPQLSTNNLQNIDQDQILSCINFMIITGYTDLAVRFRKILTEKYSDSLDIVEIRPFHSYIIFALIIGNLFFTYLKHNFIKKIQRTTPYYHTISFNQVELSINSLNSPSFFNFQFFYEEMPIGFPVGKVDMKMW